MWPKWPGQVKYVRRHVAHLNSVHQSVQKNKAATYKSFGSLGPRLESYKPPAVGRFKSSNKIGFTICLTEILRMSSVVRKEKETLWTVEGMG